MKYFYNFLIGIFMGCGAILPGVSSGVFCVIFGIYENFVNSIIYFFRDIKKNILFLLPIGLGTFIGIVLFGNIIKYFFSIYRVPACFAFIGLILGTIPALFKQASTNKCISLKEIISLFISFLIGILLIVIEKHFNMDSYSSTLASNKLYLILAGFIMSIGIVVPGVSNTIILMCLGVYSQYISAVSSVNLQILVPMCIGIFFGSILWLKIITILLSKYHEATFYSIIGFTLGSIFVLYPGFSFDFVGIISIVLLIISTILSYKLSTYEYRNNVNN